MKLLWGSLWFLFVAASGIFLGNGLAFLRNRKELIRYLQAKGLSLEEVMDGMPSWKYRRCFAYSLAFLVMAIAAFVCWWSF